MAWTKTPRSSSGARSVCSSRLLAIFDEHYLFLFRPGSPLYCSPWFTLDLSRHAMALHPDDTYLARPPIETLEALRMYGESLERYGKSPFIYPIYGLGGLPEGFSRLCAIHGGTFILNKQACLRCTVFFDPCAPTVYKSLPLPPPPG
jgi:hypothetical protein